MFTQTSLSWQPEERGVRKNETREALVAKRKKFGGVS